MPAASVLAQMMKFGSRRAATAARIRLTISEIGTTALFEYVDRVVGQSHLFKRTIILVKAWASAAGVFDYSPERGMLTALFVRTLVLFLFNAYHAQISTPLEGLYRLLEYLHGFDWDNLALSFFGPVALASFGSPQV